jgi:hypothetical protein
MTRTEYSQQARNTHIEIQELNDSLQLDIDNFYYNIDGISDIELNLIDIDYGDNYKEFKIKILSKLELLNNLFIDYFTSSRDELRYYSGVNFQLSNNLEELLGEYFDTINAELNTSDLPKITNEVVIKYIQMTVVYENIMNDLNNLDMFDNYCDKRYYNNENVITILDFIINEFYDASDNLRVLCINENNILSMIQCYMLNLKIILYIIEFIESIKYIG